MVATGIILTMSYSSGAPMANVVLPKVRLFVACLDVSLEPGSPRAIIDPLHTIRMPPGMNANYIVDDLWFFAQLTDGVGRFILSTELHNDEGMVVAKSNRVSLDFPGGKQLNVQEVRLSMHFVPFSRPGFYDFKLIVTHAHLEEGGTACLRVLGG